MRGGAATAEAVQRGQDAARVDLGQVDYSPDQIAAIVAQEAAKRRERAAAKGVLSYLEPVPKSQGTEVNRQFMRNTIRAVSSHNRRQEEEGCWRKHGLQAAVHHLGRQERGRPANRKRPREPREKSPSVTDGDTDPPLTERERWARDKAASMFNADRIKPHTAAFGESDKRAWAEAALQSSREAALAPDGDPAEPAHGRNSTHERKKMKRTKEKKKKEKKEKKKRKKERRKSKKESHEEEETTSGDE